MEDQSERKTPFFSGVLNPRFNGLKNPIEIDTSTSNINEIIVNPVSGAKLHNATVGYAVSTLTCLNGNKNITFKSNVTDGHVLDWDNSTIEYEYAVWGTTASTTNTAFTNVLQSVDHNMPWNMFPFGVNEKVDLKFNDVTVFERDGNVLSTGTIRSYIEIPKREIDADFMEFGDEVLSSDAFLGTEASANYTSGSLTALAGVTASRTAKNVVQKAVGERLKKQIKFKHAFFSIGDNYPKNLRKIALSLDINTTIKLPTRIASTYQRYIYITGIRLHLREVKLSPSQATIMVNDKMNNADDHIAFIDYVELKETASANMDITSIPNFQFLTAFQISSEVGNVYTWTDEATPTANVVDVTHYYSSPANLMFLNGYITTTAFTNAADIGYTYMPLRNDIQVQTNAAYDVPSSVQMVYRSDMYPKNPIQIQKIGETSCIDSTELYRHYLECAKLAGNDDPIDFGNFKRTHTFVALTPHDAITLSPASDVSLKINGTIPIAASAVDDRIIHIVCGYLKMINISSNSVVEKI